MPRDTTCISVHTRTQFQTTPAIPCWLRFCWMVIVLAATRCEPSPLLVLTKIGMELSGALALTKSMPRRGGAGAAAELLSDGDAGGKRSVQSMSQYQVVLYCIARQAHTMSRLRCINSFTHFSTSIAHVVGSQRKRKENAITLTLLPAHALTALYLPTAAAARFSFSVASGERARRSSRGRCPGGTMGGCTSPPLGTSRSCSGTFRTSRG